MRDHGYARYRLDGCRCYICGFARSEYDTNRKRMIAYGRWEPFVPIEETQLRIASLGDLGFGDRSIAALAGLNRKIVRDIRTGVRHDPSRGNPPLTKIRKETAVAIAAIPYDALGGGDNMLIDATMTWDRVHALIRAGYTRAWISGKIGKNGHALQLQLERVTVKNARAIRDLVQRVGMRPGPSVRAKAEGVSMGWPTMDDVLIEVPRAEVTPRRASTGVVPASQIMADNDVWTREVDDEDAMDEVAVERSMSGDYDAVLSRTERHEVVRRLNTEGLNDGEISERTGLVRRTVERDRQAMHLPPRCGPRAESAC